MTYRNRCVVLGANGVINLSVPLVGGRDKIRMTRDIEIDYSLKWQTEHWRTLCSCYNNSPFFYHYAESLKKMIMHPYPFLWELNIATITWALQQLKWVGEIIIISHPEELQGIEAEVAFPEKPSERNRHKLPAYQQTFDLPFENNLSILDLLFNLGPKSARKYLEFSIITDAKD